MTLLDLLSSNVDKPLMLLLLVPLLLLLFFFVYFNLRNVDREDRKRVQKTKKYIFFSRAIIFALLLIALASPYTIYQKLARAEPSVVFIMDNSSSYGMFDRSKGYQTFEVLEQEDRKSVV